MVLARRAERRAAPKAVPREAFGDRPTYPLAEGLT